MTRQVIHRDRGDNVYLHRDFHAALSDGIDYLKQHYGDEAVGSYLRRFANSFYAPLKAALADGGLPAIQDHFEQVYATEGGEVAFELSDDELIIEVAQCPAVMHMRRTRRTVADLWYETTKAVNEALCEGSDYAAELVDYDRQTGRSTQRFYRIRR